MALKKTQKIYVKFHLRLAGWGLRGQFSTKKNKKYCSNCLNWPNKSCKTIKKGGWDSLPIWEDPPPPPPPVRQMSQVWNFFFVNACLINTITSFNFNLVKTQFSFA